MECRPCRGDEMGLLRELFVAAVMELTGGEYSLEQRRAWVSSAADKVEFCARMEARQPFVAILQERIAGYADLQPDGLIDHFYVAPWAKGQRVASGMLQHIEELAQSKEMTTIHSFVSLTAEPFFLQKKFVVVEQRIATRAGVTLPHALLQKVLTLKSTRESLPR
ncbi:hypothetical protein A6X21_01840 [Planctopirus hydrillae]|uniref:N-acetyltransferase domain-containing protein n=2 Tax=Planctopirus hydrillae TaxID=1841610 RepID=A0A1C3EUJ7_9PLAN|nr:hypothetical protein A6X21_01840 [Planctopirus hydrillae]